MASPPSIASTKRGAGTVAAVVVASWLLAPAACRQAGAAAAEERPPLLPGASVSQPQVAMRTLGALTVWVTPDQRVSVAGETDSLRVVVDTICEMAGIVMHGYAAPQRSYVGRFENLSVVDAFRRILRSESYVLGVQAGGGKGPASTRVTWIRVLGDAPVDLLAVGAPGGAAASAPEGEPPAEGGPPSEVKPKPPFSLPGSILGPAFVSANPDIRLAAQRRLVTLLSDGATVDGFVAADTKQLVDQLGRYRNPMHALTELQDLTENPSVRAKFAEVIEGLRAVGAQPPAGP